MKTFGCHFRKSYLKLSKIIRFISKTERDFAESKNLIKHYKNQYFTKTEKRVVKTLIKPVVYEDFWVPFPQK